MKKKCKFLLSRFFKQVVMTVVCLTMTGFVVAQTDKKVSIETSNELARSVLDRLQKIADITFVYDEAIIAKDKRVTLKFSNAPLQKVLDALCQQLSLRYEMKKDLILLLKPSDAKSVVNDYVRIVGKVVSEKQEPLPGVTVVLKGSTVGTVTDAQGKYKLVLPKSKSIVLQYSFIGMVMQEIKYTGQDSINVTMKEDVKQINELVVTGYANISRQAFTGNVTTITSAELKKVSPTNVLKSLQVFDPSFRIAVNNEMGSNPNTLPNISIRGNSGIGITELEEASVSETALKNNPNLPTFILDGFEVSVEKVFDMDINRVESITILKDAAATAMYGSRAANGVIVITTFAPKPGEIFVNYNYNLALEIPDLSDYNLMDAREKVEAEYAAGLFKDYAIDYYHRRLLNIEKGINTDWLSLPLRNASNSKHFLRLEGGSRELRYGLDVSYNGNKGVMKGSKRQTWGFSLDLQYNLADRLVFKNVASFSAVNSEDSPYGNFSQYTTMNPYLSYKDENGKIMKKIPTLTANQTILNPLYEATLDSYSKQESKEFINNFSLQYWLPSRKINFKANIALSYRVGDSDSYTSPESGKYGEYAEWKGEKTMGHSSVSSVDGGIFGYYNDMINNHYINLVAGVNFKETKDKSTSIYMRDLPAGGYDSPQFAGEVPEAPSANGQKSRLFGAMISMNYTYNNIYLLDITGRLDGNSSFGSEKRFAPFWSGGVGINLHNYQFIRDLGWITNLKLRGSYGVTGKANFPTRTARTVYVIGGESESGLYPSGIGATMATMGNRNLKWEKTRILDVGFDINLFDNLIALVGTYYRRLTVDLIADMYVASSSGFTSYKENVGEILNDGYELSARFRFLNNNNMSWFVGGNLAANKNRIQKISDAMKTYNEQVEAKYSYRDAKPLLKFEEGASTTSIYAVQSQGIDPQTGKEMFLYKDGSSGFEWSATETVVCGNTEPKINGSLFSNFSWKGLSFDLYFTYTYGGQQYNQTLQEKIENADIQKNCDKRVFTERWKEPGDVKLYKSLKDWDKTTQATSRFVQDDNTLTLSSVSLTYDFPREFVRKLKLDRIKLGFNMNDVFRVSSIKQERGTAYPFARSYNFSINVGF